MPSGTPPSFHPMKKASTGPNAFRANRGQYPAMIRRAETGPSVVSLLVLIRPASRSTSLESTLRVGTTA
jgi:hypothetical protein